MVILHCILYVILYFIFLSLIHMIFFISAVFSLNCCFPVFHQILIRPRKSADYKILNVCQNELKKKNKDDQVLGIDFRIHYHYSEKYI